MSQSEQRTQEQKVVQCLNEASANSYQTSRAARRVTSRAALLTLTFLGFALGGVLRIGHAVLL